MGAKSCPLSSKDGKKLQKDILGDAESLEIHGVGEVSLVDGVRNSDESIDSPLDLLELKTEKIKLVRHFHASKETGLLLDQMLWQDPKLECIIQFVKKVEQNMAVESAYADQDALGSSEGLVFAPHLEDNYES